MHTIEYEYQQKGKIDKNRQNTRCGEGLSYKEKIKKLEIQCARLEEDNRRMNKIEKELEQMQEKTREACNQVSMKSDEVELLEDELDYYKFECEGLEAALNQSKETISVVEISRTNQQREWEIGKRKYEDKIKKLDEALKAKSKQLIDKINRDRGGNVDRS